MYPTYPRLQRAIAAIVIGGSLAVILVGTDRFFPFSNYPMYSSVFIPSPDLDIYLVRGVFKDGSVRPLEIGQYLYPFNPASYRESLLSDLQTAAINRKLSATLRWYNHESAEHDSAKLSLLSVRVYRSPIPWSKFVESQKTNQNMRDLIRQNASIIGEAHE